MQNNVQDTIYKYTSIKYLDNSNHLLYQRVYFILFYSKCDIQWTFRNYYWLISNYMDKSLLEIPDLLRNIYCSHLKS